MSQHVTSNKAVNGVDVTRLMETIEAIKVEPGLATFHFRTQNQWIEGGHNRSTIRDFYGAGAEDTTRTATFTLDADEPDVLLGGDKGANPVEALLHSLAACMTTSLVYHAAARGIRIESVESQLEGDLDLHGFLGLNEGVRPGYQNIRARFKVTSNADAGELEDLFRYSPVHNSIAQPVPVHASIEVVRA